MPNFLMWLTHKHYILDHGMAKEGIWQITYYYHWWPFPTFDTNELYTNPLDAIRRCEQLELTQDHV